MKTVFPKQYDMIIELDRLEKLMPDYSELLRKLSLVIRNKVWDKSNEEKLAFVLNICNKVFEILVDRVGDQIEFLEMYVDCLNKYSRIYSGYNLSNDYNGVLENIKILKTQELVNELWKQINPYFRKEYAPNDLLSKDFIEILDDIFEMIVKTCSNVFVLPMNNEQFKHLSRGRRGRWKEKKDLAAPPIEIAQKYNVINRWNPPSKRYLYLVDGDGSDNDIDTACEEMRIKTDEELTVATFQFLEESKKPFILDLDYEDISRQKFFDNAELYIKEQVMEIIYLVYSEGVNISKEEIDRQIKLYVDKMIWHVKVLSGRIFFKEVCETIFVPLDEDEDNDNDKKDKCYKSFHILAEYLEKRGYRGIRYPSTRMRLIGKKGRNLVLFNADSAEAVEGTFHTLKKC